jgi:hypothetical protein
VMVVSYQFSEVLIWLPYCIIDCIRSAPESRPRLTVCDLLTRPHGLAFGVTDGARTRDLRSHKWVVEAPGAVGAGLSRVRQ